MSSVESSVITYLETKIAALTGAPTASNHFYDLNKNDGVNNDFIYAVRSGAASRTEGAVGRATYNQEFEIEISRDFIEAAGNDEALRDAIEAIREKFEALTASVVGKPSGNILNIQTPDFSAPEINSNQKSVSLIYTYPVKYFVSTRSA